MDTLRRSFRRLRRTRLTLPILLLLAVGVGANGALLSVAGTLRQPPPGVEAPERLAAVFSQHTENGQHGYLSLPDWQDDRDAQTVFERFEAFSDVNVALRGSAATELVAAEVVTGGYFATLGVSFGNGGSGRTILPGDDASAVVLGHGLWQRAFGGRPMLGEALRLNGRAFTVVGIAPPFFRGLNPERPASAWLPLEAKLLLRRDGEQYFYNRGTQWLTGVGRLRHDVDLETARRELRELGRRRLDSRADVVQGYLPQVEPAAFGAVPPDRQRDTRRLLGILGAATGLLLLVIAVSAANLFLAQSLARGRELAVRLALGSPRWHLLRGFLLENALLGALGGALGLATAHGLVRALAGQQLSDLLPGVAAARPEIGSGLASALLLLAVLTAVLAGTAPLLRVLAIDIREELGSRSAGEGPGRRRLWNGLVVAEVALAALLLVGAVLVLRAWREIHGLELGFEPRGVHLFSLNVRSADLDEPAQQRLFQEARDRLRALPEVADAAIASTVPLGGTGYMGQIVVDGFERRDDGSTHDWVGNVVGPGYFSTLGIPVVRGRAFDQRDTAGAPRVAVVSRSMADAYWPGGLDGALGRTFQLLRRGVPEPVTVVGVAEDSWFLRSWKGKPGPHLYLPLAQEHPWWTRLLVRSAAPGAADAVRREMSALAPDLPLYDVTSYEDLLRSSLAKERTTAVLLGASGALALVLAGFGLYATLAFAVARRKGEIGIRMALGADPRSIVSLVVGSGLRLAVLGLAVGLGVGAWLSGHLADVLLRIRPGEPAAYVQVALLVLALALAAAFLPGRAAARVDPLASLRQDSM